MPYRTTSFLCLAFLVAVGAAASGCSPSTKVVETWKDPGFTGPIDFKRTLVIAIHPDRYARNVTEDTLVEHIGPDRAVAGHNFLTDEERQGSMKLTSKLGEG